VDALTGECVLSACYSENVARSMFGTSAVTDEQFESGVVQPVSPDWFVRLLTHQQSVI